MLSFLLNKHCTVIERFFWQISKFNISENSFNWWIGYCEYVGQDFGYAYLPGNKKCPGYRNLFSDDSSPFPNGWRRFGTNELLEAKTKSRLNFHFLR